MRKGGGNIGFQDDHSASCGVPGSEFIGFAPLEVILRENLVRIESIGFHALTG